MTDRRMIRFRLASDDDLSAMAALQLPAAILPPVQAKLRRLLDGLPPGPARYEGEGHYFANVTGFLREEQGLVAETLRLLDPARYTAESLRNAFEEGQFSDPRCGEQMLDAIRVLHANVEAAGDRTLLVEL